MAQELKVFEVTGKALFGRFYTKKVYDKDEVDAVLEAKDAKILHLNAEVMRQKHHANVFMEERNTAEKNVRRLERALWLTRAERADDRARIFYFNDLETMLDIDGFSYDSKKKKGCKKLTARQWRIIWENVKCKCRAKAEAHK